MPLEPLEAFDYTSELLYPHLAFPSATTPQQVTLAKRIRLRPKDEILLLAPTAISFPPVVAGLTLEQVEAVMRLGALNQKTELLGAFDSTEQINHVETIAKALGRETGEDQQTVAHRLARMRLYLNDHRSVFAPRQP